MALNPCPECGKLVSSEAEACPQCGRPIKPRVGEPEFRAHIRRVLIGSAILCGVGLPVGIVLENPAVVVLAALGLAVAGWKLSRPA
jgi:hypothetical protein